MKMERGMKTKDPLFDYLNTYAVDLTPQQARALQVILLRIDIDNLLVGEAITLNYFMERLEEIGNE